MFNVDAATSDDGLGEVVSIPPVGLTDLPVIDAVSDGRLELGEPVLKMVILAVRSDVTVTVVLTVVASKVTVRFSVIVVLKVR